MKKLNILVLGSGGREHTFCWKLAQSQMVSEIFVAPGNAGTAAMATNLDVGVNDFDAIKDAVIQNNIEFVVVGPEDPLVNGIHDFFLDDTQLKNIPVIGPQKLGATLEGSKEFAKAFMSRHNIPTAQYGSFTAKTLQEGYAFLDQMKAPYVLKADGLAAGKGVLIINDLEIAKKELSNMLLEQKFGEASSKVVIEEFLSGIELSCFVLTDGNDYVTFPMAKDYKRIGEGDTGLNTGGMGAISPVPFADEKFYHAIQEKIVKPTMEGLKKDNIPYVGFVFIGLIRAGNDPFVIEYNVRMGDPETQPIMMRLKSDLLELLWAATDADPQTLSNIELQWDRRCALGVVMAAANYPATPELGQEIHGLPSDTDEAMVFHAGTVLKDGKIFTSGGRVLCVTTLGDTVKQAQTHAYALADQLHFKGMQMRRDIGFRAIRR